MRWLLVVASSMFVSVGCTPRNPRCEHAHEVVVAMWERASGLMKRSLDPAAAASFEADVHGQLERARGDFILTCLQLPPEGQACIDRIDEIAAVERERLAEVERCPLGGDGAPEQGCADAARDRANQRTADCEGALASLFLALPGP